MKITILTTAMLFTFLLGNAQRTVQLKSKGKSESIITDRPPQAVYFQIGGSAPILSVNYDRRFSKKVNGFGFAAGLGFFGVSGSSIFSVPVSLNYLIGKDSHFMELAAGGTFVSTTTSDFFSNGTNHGSAVLGHFNLGYRYQPSNGGFFFRGGISPLFYGGEYATSYYVGFGHNF